MTTVANRYLLAPSGYIPDGATLDEYIASRNLQWRWTDMALINDDSNDPVNLNDVRKIVFVNTQNPPLNEKAILHNGSTVSSIGQLSTIRALIGVGHGPSWVQLQGGDAFANLDHVTTVQYQKAANGEITGAVVLAGNANLGVVKSNQALAAVKQKFQPS